MNMLEILEFIFQDFWHWLGTLILIVCLPIPLRGIYINTGSKKEEKEE